MELLHPISLGMLHENNTGIALVFVLFAGFNPVTDKEPVRSTV